MFGCSSDRGDPRLADESLAEPVVRGELGREHLQRDLRPSRHVLGAVDDAHAAPAEQPLSMR